MQLTLCAYWECLSHWSHNGTEEWFSRSIWNTVGTTRVQRKIGCPPAYGTLRAWYRHPGAGTYRQQCSNDTPKIPAIVSDAFSLPHHRPGEYMCVVLKKSIKIKKFGDFDQNLCCTFLRNID